MKGTGFGSRRMKRPVFLLFGAPFLRFASCGLHFHVQSNGPRRASHERLLSQCRSDCHAAPPSSLLSALFGRLQQARSALSRRSPLDIKRRKAAIQAECGDAASQHEVGTRIRKHIPHRHPSVASIYKLLLPCVRSESRAQKSRTLAYWRP